LGIKDARSWTAEQDAIVGTLPSKELAPQLGRSVLAIETRRRKLGIPLRDPWHRRWTPAEDALLGAQPDFQTAALLSRTPEQVGERRRRLRIPPVLPVKTERRLWT